MVDIDPFHAHWNAAELEDKTMRSSSRNNWNALFCPPVQLHSSVREKGLLSTSYFLHDKPLTTYKRLSTFTEKLKKAGGTLIVQKSLSCASRLNYLSD